MANLLDKNTLKLLRLPFSFLLMPIFLLASSQTFHIDYPTAIASFVIIHFLVYPASNGYNSYIDKDEESIGGIEKPPTPTKNLFYLTSIMDILALLLSVFLVSLNFAWHILFYILASRAYSSKQIRLKKYPLLGFLTVVIFQGAFTYVMCSVGISNAYFKYTESNIFILLACSFQIAGVYPLTQIYQHQQDLKDGVVTLSYRLGFKGTFIFTGFMFLLCNLCYFNYFNQIHQLTPFYLLQAFFLPIVAYFSYWFYLVLKNSTAANFKNTMRMNLVAALLMNLCFLFLNLFKFPQ